MFPDSLFKLLQCGSNLKMVKKKFKESLDHKSLHHQLVSPTMITDFGAIYGIGLELSGIQ